MDPDIKAKWIATLRSGNYQQGRRVLRDHNNLCCCLGVLCDILEPNGWASSRQTGSYYHRGNGGFPSKTLLQEVGLSFDDASTLATLNDGGETFEAIATHIEKNL